MLCFFLFIIRIQWYNEYFQIVTTVMMRQYIGSISYSLATHVQLFTASVVSKKIIVSSTLENPEHLHTDGMNALLKQSRNSYWVCLKIDWLIVTGGYSRYYVLLTDGAQRVIDENIISPRDLKPHTVLYKFHCVQCYYCDVCVWTARGG